MNSTYVKAAVSCYFRYKRQCPLICYERGIDNYISNPDVLVIDSKRHLIEIEVKVALSDLKNDCKKRIWVLRNNEKDDKVKSLYEMPYQFYYAVPTKLKEKALKILEEWKLAGKKEGKTGLLVVRRSLPSLIGLDDVYVAKRAPINKKSGRLSLKNIVIMARHQSGTLCSLSKGLARLTNDFESNGIEYEI